MTHRSGVESLSQRAVVTALVAVSMLLGVGCGSSAGSSPAEDDAASGRSTSTSTSSTSTTQPKAVEPCALLTQEEAQQLIGTPLEAGVAVRETCTYTGPTSGPTAQVEVFVGDGAKKILDVDRDLDHVITPVPGVGDESLTEDGAIFVRVGSTWVSIRLVSLDDPAVFTPRLEDAARTVAGRL